MWLIIGALFLNATALFFFALSGLTTVIVPFASIYASLKLHRFDLSSDVLILILYLGYTSFLIDHKLQPIF